MTAPRAWWWLLSLLLWGVAQAGNLPIDLKDSIRDQYGAPGVERLVRWEKLVWDLAYQSTPDKLRKVNDFFNGLKFETDQRHWGQEDYWATPFETLASNGGDCEDFAILKKRELVSMGWPSSALLLTVVRARGTGHTVLTIRTAEGDLILDNRTSRIKDWSRTPYRYFARQAQGTIFPKSAWPTGTSTRR